VTFNGNLFINCDINHNNNHLEIDIQSDEVKTRLHDEDREIKQELQVYDSSFKKFFIRLIEEK
jgi:hypothetical protein